jgi:phenylalanyl-tRNA synthetase beta subunit
MKKLLAIFCAGIMMVAMAISAFAATTKNDIIAEMNSGIQIGTQTRQIPAQYVKLAEDFLNANNLTDAQLSTALSNLKEAKETWASTGKVSFNEIPSDVQTKLENMAVEAAKKLGATLTFDGKTISVVDKNGKTYSTSTQSNPIKQTGVDYTALTVVMFTILGSLGAIVAVSAKNHLVKVH